MQEVEFYDKLQRYPALKNQFEQILLIVENPEEEITLANEAERRLVQEMRTLGKMTLQSWANRQSTRSCKILKKQKTGLRKHNKKNLYGIVVTEK